MQEKKKIFDLRINAIEKQEALINTKIEESRKEIDSKISSKKS